VEFIQENILLIGLVLGSGVMLLFPSMQKSASGVANISSAEAVTLINRSHAVVVDVRDKAAFEEGHIAQAKSFPLAELDKRLAELKKYKDKPILVNCQRGVNGVKACELLTKAEFSQVSHLKGGLDAWIKEKMPIVKATT